MNGKIKDIKVIIGLGNPGKKYYLNRHSIGFRVVDKLAEKCGASWKKNEYLEYTKCDINGNSVLLVKPQSFMNASGNIWPFLNKRGIKPEQMLVIHDELELPFGKLAYKKGGSARGHNGLRSIIQACGSQDFARLRFGIDRPKHKEDVAAYVLHNFVENPQEIELLIDQAITMIEQLFEEV